MKKAPSLFVFFALAVAASGVVYLVLPAGDAAQDWEQRRILFQEAAIRAEPIIEAITAYTSTVGNPPHALVDIVPRYMEKLPVTGLQACNSFEYRSLTHKQALFVWYDLGSRQGQAFSGRSRYRDGDPDHAILMLALDSQDKITSATIDRLPKGREPLDFESARWKAREDRIEMALALADSYRLHGMPRSVFEPLLGLPDGSRVAQSAPWELRVNCSMGLLNHDAFVYWPTEKYPEHLYGGKTESVGRWVYIHS
jgi:hypothetical protein